MNKLRLATLVATLTLAPVVGADTGHGHDGHGDGAMAMQGDMFMKKKTIDGYQVTFHVMPAQKGMEHGGSHNFMLKVERDGRVVTDAKVNSKVIHPNGASDSKMMMRMGDWYMAGYDLGHDGKHQLLVLFKAPDGRKHTGGVW